MLKGKCPNCGAQYVKQTARHTAGARAASPAAAPEAAEPGQNAAFARWQLIFGGILMVAVVAAVIVLISASLDAREPALPPATPTVEMTTPPPTTPPPTPTPSPTVAVTSITLQTAYNGQTAPDSFTQRTTWAPVQLKAVVYPTEALNDAKVIWKSSDEAVGIVDETGLVTAVGPGECEIIVECGGVAASVKVLVPG